MLDGFVEWAPSPIDRETNGRTVPAVEEKFSGFIFKNTSQYGPENIVIALPS